MEGKIPATSQTRTSRKVWGKQNSYLREPHALTLGFQKRQALSSVPCYWLSISEEPVTGLNESLWTVPYR